MRAVGMVVVVLGVDAALLGGLFLLVEAISPTLTLTLPAGIVFLAGISGLLAGAGLIRWARIRRAARYWQS